MGDSEKTATDSDRREAPPRSTLFVGRERELAELSGGLSDALSGRGGLFLIVGEPGIGKTRLAGELGDYAARRGARVLWGRCWEGEGAPPYWPWVQLLRSYLREEDPETIAQEMGSGATYVSQIVPEVRERLGALPPPATSLESEHARFALFDAITRFLTKAAETKPLLVTLDDLHWADKASLLLLQFVAHELHRAPILVLGTYREAEVRQAAEVMEVLAVVSRDAHHVPLRGLSEAQVGQVIEAIAGRPASAAMTRTVRQATEGNPFFVDELARLLAAEGRIGGPEAVTTGAYPVPQGIREAIRRRLKPLSAECRRVLSVACVVGREFDLAVLQQVCDLSIERLLALLGEVLAAGMVVETSAPLGRFSFSHALVRETLYDDLGPVERPRLHREIGEILAGLYRTNPEPHLAELAHHFLRAGPVGDPAKAIDYAIRAARRASSLLAHDEAAVHYEHALELLERERESEERRADVLLSLGEALSRAGDPAGARKNFQRAAELSRRLRDPERLARAALGFGGGGFGGVWAVSRAHDEVLVSLLEEAARSLGSAQSVLRARVLARLATALHYAPARERRESLSREAVDVARRSEDVGALAYSLAARHYALCGPGDLGERLEIADEILRVAERAGDPELTLLGRGWRLVDLVEICDLFRAGHEIEAHARLADDLRQPFHAWYATMWRAMYATATGRFEDSERLANEALEIGRRSQEENAVTTFAAQRINLRWLQGGPIDEAMAAHGRFDIPGAAGWRYSLALTYAKAGREDDARRELERVAHGVETDLSHGASRLLHPCFEAETVALLGDAARAAPLYESLLPHAEFAVVGGHDAVTWYGSVSHYLGLLAATIGRPDAAVQHFRDAIAMHERAGAQPWLALSACECARVLVARGGEEDRGKALALSSQALEIAEKTGMAGLVESARALKVRAGGPENLKTAPPGAAPVEEHTPVEAAAGVPQGTVTLMFSDMEGFTEMTERLGDAAALEVIHAHNKIVRDQLKAHGGSELELQGDGFLLAFPKAGSALRCALAIQRALLAYSAEHPDQPIRVRIGIHSGEPIKEAERFFGKSLILAARIAAQGRGGEILVSSVVKDLCESMLDVRFDEGRDVELKGISGRRRIFRVLWGGEEEIAPPPVTPEARLCEGNLFRREGEYWTIAYEGKAFRLKDSKGLGYLAELLRNPGRELHVAAMVGGTQAEPSVSAGERAESTLAVSGLGDAGEILDAQAKAEYGRRLEDLREALAEAERLNDQERAARARAEIDFLSQELASAVGLGGRDRKAASAVERARLNVTLAIKAALKRIAEQSPSLGRHLQATVSTGKFCSYTPDPRVPISWTH